MKFTSALIGRIRSRFSAKKDASKYNMVKVFSHNGHAYYRMAKEVNLPLERFAMVMGLLERLSSGISGTEMDKILTEMEKAVAAGLSNPKNASAVSAYIHVIRERQDTVIHRDLLLNIAATNIIRDDENPAVINPDIHQQKLDVFDALSKEGAHDFFYSLGIEPLMPLFSMSAKDFQTLWEYNTASQKNLIRSLQVVDSHRRKGQKEQQTA